MAQVRSLCDSKQSRNTVAHITLKCPSVGLPPSNSEMHCTYVIVYTNNLFRVYRQSRIIFDFYGDTQFTTGIYIFFVFFLYCFVPLLSYLTRARSKTIIISNMTAASSQALGALTTFDCYNNITIIVQAQVVPTHMCGRT